MNEGLFYLRSAARFAILPVARRLLRGRYRRTPSAVQDEYDPQRADFLARFRPSKWPLDEYVLREAGEDLEHSYYFANVLDGRLILGCEREVRSRLLLRLQAAISSYSPGTVIEVGAGTGRNLLWLKSKMPSVTAIGLELSEPSVSVAREAADRYGLDVRFERANVLEPWPVGDADVVYSVHAVEQIPDAPQAIEAMVAHARKAVVMFEPLPDLWNGLWGVAGRLRGRYLDRLPAGAVDRFHVTKKELVPDGMALNRTSEIHITPAGG